MKKKINIKKFALTGVLIAFKENRITLNQVIEFIEIINAYKNETI